MKELEHNPGSPAWHLARRGVVTASEANRFLKPSDGKMRTGEMPRSYMADKLAEMVGWAKDEFQGSVHTQRGHDLEPRARSWAAMELGMDVRPCSLILSDCGRMGCTPDGIFDDGSLLEVKAPAENTYFKYALKGNGVPEEHRLQVEFQLAVTGAPANHFLIYVENESLAHRLVTIEPSDLTATVRASAEEFCASLWEGRSLIADPAYHEEA